MVLNNSRNPQCVQHIYFHKHESAKSEKASKWVKRVPVKTIMHAITTPATSDQHVFSCCRVYWYAQTQESEGCQRTDSRMQTLSTNFWNQNNSTASEKASELMVTCITDRQLWANKFRQQQHQQHQISRTHAIESCGQHSLACTSHTYINRPNAPQLPPPPPP